MFFPERVKNIKTSDKVLEIGPGADPHPRSDVLLERCFSNSEEATEQRGHTPELKTDKKIVYYDGDVFPFAAKEFDYVICSHVIEHIEDIEFFMSEIFRVTSRGYLEYPTIYYEYLYNFEVHKNFIKMTNKGLYYYKKCNTNLNEFDSVHAVFRQSLAKGYSEMVQDLISIMFEGFEWAEPFPVVMANKITDVCDLVVNLPIRNNTKNNGILGRLISLIKRG